MTWTSFWGFLKDRGEFVSNEGCYDETLARIGWWGTRYASLTSAELLKEVAAVRNEMSLAPESPDSTQRCYALIGEVSHRTLGQRPYRCQLIGALGISSGRIVEMQTGEGKTLSAVISAAALAFRGRHIHVLTFNDYLAQRDASVMRPIYDSLGIEVGVIQQGMNQNERRNAYSASITYGTAKEAAFDSLRDGLAKSQLDLVQGDLDYAIIDEADSILIDESRIPLVIAGQRPGSGTAPSEIAAMVAGLEPDTDWQKDGAGRNVQLTEKGALRIEQMLKINSLYNPENESILLETNQALHARALLHRNVDYIVRDSQIKLVDDLTGRIVEERRWPDGLQAALEAREGLPIQPGGKILGSVTMLHFITRYKHFGGMTATATQASKEFIEMYGKRILKVVSHVPCLREDLPDRLFLTRKAKDQAIIDAIIEVHKQRRPILVGTSTIEESDKIATSLRQSRIDCVVLNARYDKAEAEIVASAGRLDAVTISTNMAGRGTDIRLGGPDEKEREAVVVLGGLFILSTTRYESSRVDQQLRGRAGRRGDPGTSCFFVSEEDQLFSKTGVNRSVHRQGPDSETVTRGELKRVKSNIDHAQRVMEGKNQAIRATLNRYFALIESQRRTIMEWRKAILMDQECLDLADMGAAEIFNQLVINHGSEKAKLIVKIVTLAEIDSAWAGHLNLVASIRDGIHLVTLSGMDPLREFYKRVAPAFASLHASIQDAIIGRLSRSISDFDDIDCETMLRPSATWTYLINDRATSDIFVSLHGSDGSAANGFGAMILWPLLLAWGAWSKINRKSRLIRWDPPKAS